MKAPVVDYREFRLSRLNEPRFSHLKLLAGWLVYFLAYFLTENLIPLESCHVIHMGLDDIIPFHEGFVLAYTFWYVWIVGSLLYFVLYNIESFKNLQKYIIITQIVATAIYIIYPNRQDLRPEIFPRDNFLTDVVALIYSFDTNSNVCPSLHVAYSIGIASVWCHEKGIARWIKGSMVALAIIISASTWFIKQHSVMDAIVALPVCLLAEYLLFIRKKSKKQ